MRLHPRILAALAVVALAGACSSGSDDTVESTPESTPQTSPESITEATTDRSAEDFPDVIAVDATTDGDSWTFAVTISSPYDTPQRYADAWRVVGPDGTVYGERILAHDHASEQPFTRSQSGIRIPNEVRTVLVEARDSVNGWGGATLEHDLAGIDG